MRIETLTTFALRITVSVFLIAGWHHVANAHEVRPLITTITVDENNRISADMSVNIEAMMSNFGHTHSNAQASKKAKEYARLRKASASQLELEFKRYAERFLKRIQVEIDGKASVPVITDIDIPKPGNVKRPRKSRVVITVNADGTARSFTWRYKSKPNVVRVMLSGDKKPFFSKSLKAGEKSEPIKLTSN